MAAITEMEAETASGIEGMDFMNNRVRFAVEKYTGECWKVKLPPDIYRGEVSYFKTVEEADKYIEEHIPSEAWHHVKVSKVR